MGEPSPDLALVERLRGGDPTALDELMARYASRVWRLARGVTRNDADAEEVAQDVFLTLTRKGDMFEGRAALGSWIYRITMNTALNKRRGKRAEVEVPLEEMLPAYREDGHRAGDRAYLLIDWSRGPEAELLSAEARAVIRRTIDRLPDRYRAVLVMRDIEELSNEETAAALGETVSAVKSTLHRARMALREELTRHHGGRT
jgi:RNA polymerase sigma-70 factor (ECF subfamily)